MAKRRKKFTYLMSKSQIQLIIEALLIARSSGAHAKVYVNAEDGESHVFNGIVNDGSIDKLVDKYEADGCDYEVKLTAEGVPYDRSEDKILEQTINLFNESLGEIEQAEEEAASKKAAAETPELINKLYEMLESEK